MIIALMITDSMIMTTTAGRSSLSFVTVVSSVSQKNALLILVVQLGNLIKNF